MAGHLAIETTKLHLGLFEICKHYDILRNSRDFEKVNIFESDNNNPIGYMMKLPIIDYNMDEETGMIDKEIYSFVSYDLDIIETYEIHIGYSFNGELKINQIYLVM
jgi:hypothetical protein